MGQEAIKAHMNPKIVDAMKAVHALEDGVMVDNDAEEQDGNKKTGSHAKKLISMVEAS